MTYRPLLTDGQVLRRRYMLSSNDPNDRTAESMNEGSNSDKQVMTVLNFVPFAINFDRRIDLFYSIIQSGNFSIKMTCSIVDNGH